MKLKKNSTLTRSNWQKTHQIILQQIILQQHERKQSMIKLLTRWEVAELTEVLVTVLPELMENKTIINTLCANYTDQEEFIESQASAIEHLCTYAIMWIHNEDRTPLTTFEYARLIPSYEFSWVMSRTLSWYEKEWVEELRAEVEGYDGKEDKIWFSTLLDIFLKNQGSSEKLKILKNKTWSILMLLQVFYTL